MIDQTRQKGYIYKIINDLNNYVYVGQTKQNLSIRFSQHKSASLRVKSFDHNTIFHKAMRTLGPEHFQIVLLEETEFLDEREKYWIEKLDSFNNGYNGTIGGSGQKLNVKQIIELTKTLQNYKEVGKILNLSSTTIRNIILSNEPELGRQISKNHKGGRVGKKIFQIDSNGKIIKIHNGALAAAKEIKGDKCFKEIESARVNIGQVCRGKRKTAYGYLWKYEE